MISIVSTNFRMSGSYINHLDTYDFLRQYKPRYYYMDHGEVPLWKMLAETGRNYKLQNPIKLNWIVEDDIVITDFRGLIVLNYEKIHIRAKRIIIFDCMELTFHLNRFSGAVDWFFWFDNFSYLSSIYNYFTNLYCDEMLFLMPPSNHKKFIKQYPDLQAKIFYKKINVPVLMKHRDIPLFNQKEFIYRRKREKKWHDQFGRTIFEFIILGKDVIFKGDPFWVDDGLSDYLKYYDIRFDKEKTVTEPEKLVQRMENNGKYLQSELLL